MSSANIALFIDEHLKSIKEPSRIYYKFKKESTREDNFVGNVVLNIVKLMMTTLNTSLSDILKVEIK